MNKSYKSVKFHGQSMYSYQTHNDRIVVCTWKIKFIIVERYGSRYSLFKNQQRILVFLWSDLWSFRVKTFYN